MDRLPHHRPPVLGRRLCQDRRCGSIASTFIRVLARGLIGAVFRRREERECVEQMKALGFVVILSLVDEAGRAEGDSAGGSPWSSSIQDK